MVIGIDLDNTLLDCELAFSAAVKYLNLKLPSLVNTKHQIREFIRSQPDGENTWQKLQGLAYGPCLQSHARLYPGVKRFLWRCRQKGYYLKVISHKTEYGHLDEEKLPLRQIALNFLKSQGLLETQNPLIQDVTFETTRLEKINYITQQAFNWFIDDLPEVINDLSKVQGLKTILFNPLGHQSSGIPNDQQSHISLSDWQQIDMLINGEWTFSEIDQLSRQLLNREAVTIEKVSNGGNAGVYRLALPENTWLKLKVYPVDSKHDRLTSEFLATKGITELGGKNIPRPLAKDTELGIGIYEWIDGVHVTTPNQHDLKSSLDFLRSLHMMRSTQQFSHAPLASAACLSGDDIEKQMSYRFNQFDQAKAEYPELDRFLSGDFLPTFKELVRWARDNWPVDVGFDKPLSRAQQTLSPSDFGFHNVIRRVDGSLAFLDFEYFGWDDPVKLMSDFSFHPGMCLSDEQKSFWLQGALQIYGEEMSERLRVCRPLYGLIWCLILLNDFRQEIWHRRMLANDSKQALKNKTLDQQLSKAKSLLTKIQLTHADA